MAVLKKKDIKGMYVDGGRLYCRDCVDSIYGEDYSLDSIVTRQDLEKSEGDLIYFCDECKSPL